MENVKEGCLKFVDSSYSFYINTVAKVKGLDPYVYRGEMVKDLFEEESASLEVKYSRLLSLAESDRLVVTPMLWSLLQMKCID